jgi:succinyl-CoA synthetase alpha subunit
VAVIVDNDTRLVVQGLTGSEGRFHGLRNRAYGTNVVAGVTPGKGGQDVEGIPVFNTVADAVEKAGANASLIFVPARFAADAIYEAVDAGIPTVICITEHVPVHEMLKAYTYFRSLSSAEGGVTMIGPNCPGVLSPGKTMGHAGAIISGSSGTAQAKKEALEAKGIEVGTTPTEVARMVADRMR